MSAREDAEAEEDRTEALIRRGSEAKRLLNDALLKEAFESIQAEIVAKMDQPNLAIDAIERLYLLRQAANSFVGYFKRVVADGDTAKAHLDDLVKADEQHRKSRRRERIYA